MVHVHLQYTLYVLLVFTASIQVNELSASCDGVRQELERTQADCHMARQESEALKKVLYSWHTCMHGYELILISRFSTHLPEWGVGSFMFS